MVSTPARVEEGLCPTLIGLWPGSGRSLRCSLCAVLWSSRVVQILDTLDPKPLPRISHYPENPATSSANPSLRHPFPFTLQGARKGAVSSSPFLFSSTQKAPLRSREVPREAATNIFSACLPLRFFLSFLSHLRHLTAAGTVCLPRRRLASSASLFVSVSLLSSSSRTEHPNPRLYEYSHTSTSSSSSLQYDPATAEPSHTQSHLTPMAIQAPIGRWSITVAVAARRSSRRRADRCSGGVYL
jgi:hypothetical protein